MIELIQEFFSIPAFSRAAVALVASGVAFPAIGTIILCLELIPARFAVMHVALLGAALGMVINLDPTFSALLAAALSGLLIARLGDRSGTSAGGPLGLVMILSLALAFILFYKTDIQAIEAFNLFWGNVLALSQIEIRLVLAAAFLFPLLIIAFYRPIMAVLFDKELAAASGYPAKIVYYALVMAVCIGIGIAMRLTGALMADATSILPALAARNMKANFRKTLIFGALFGLINNIGGFLLALMFDLPASPAIIVVGASMVLVSTMWSKQQNKKVSATQGA